MNKKGFTLVELIGVIALLAILIILVSTNIVKFTKDANDNLDESTKKVLNIAAEDYLNSYVEVKPNGEYTVTIANLISKDIISSNFLEAQNEKLITENSCIIVKYTNGYANYEFNYDCSE